MTCRTPVTHHAYPQPEDDGYAPCCGVLARLLHEAKEVITTDPAKVTCSNGGKG